MLDTALELRLAARSTPFVTLCLSGYAQLASAEGDPDRAALLESAAEGVRGRASAYRHGRIWDRVESDLVAQVRHRLGPGQFDQAFCAGSGLTQRGAVAIVQDWRSCGTQAN